MAVLTRRGRFLVAERLFPPRDAPAAPPRRGRSGGMVVGSPRSAGAREGDLVLVGQARRGSGARVLRRIGRPEVARDLIEGLMLDRGLSRAFPAAVESEAAAAAERVRSSGEDRRDLRELPTFTIDPVSARDFDDALSARQEGPETVRIWVHIADVSAHVREGSVLDREARRRGTSVYVPGAVEPMLPHGLSSEACSLMPGVDRPAVTVELELRGDRVAGASFYRSTIRSDERLDYDRVDRIFAGSEPAREPWGTPLDAARRAAAALQHKRERSGALTLDSPEPEVAFDEQGNVIEIHGSVQTESHRLVEHLMIAANEAVAELLSRRGIPTLYRVHERPDPERVQRLVDQLASLDVPTPPVPERMSSTQAAELMGAISVRLEEHLRRSAGRGRIGLTSLLLRSLKQAYYSPQNIGHAGLHSEAYCHFTSPIRRYPDIVCHRALMSAIGTGEPAPRRGELADLGVWTSEREREAAGLERDADDIASCFALERILYREGSETVLAGEVAGLISAGAFIAFSTGRETAGQAPPPFEGMLPVRMLTLPQSEAGRRRRPDSRGRGRPHEPQQREWWELNEEGTILRGERTGAVLRLGDPIEVRVGRVDTVRGRVDLLPAG